jgi:hypothetical protein
MGLKTCVWCDQRISDAASRCPKCKREEPFDAAKRDSELRATARSNEIKSRREYALAEEISCTDCGLRRPIREIFAGRSTCPNCGNPNNRPKCSLCDKYAYTYDQSRGIIVCATHEIVLCEYCGKPIEIGRRDKYIWILRRKANAHARCIPLSKQDREGLIFLVIVVGIILSIAYGVIYQVCCAR